MRRNDAARKGAHMAGIPLYCERCSTLRAVEDWRETSPQTLTIALSPCGHQQERTARMEWREPMLLVARRASHRSTATAVSPHRARSSERPRLVRALGAR